ncbi:hypothetical protein [Dactylosporangium sp. NPDC048998]|uniref:DUF6414 family protein n=1 Tax=Dactylosporangium sp. NPDC048998 TaxID=3363976 RepID=UPI0037152D8A
MAKAREKDDHFLAHPVYLDVPMMVSFLATLDDGVAYTSEVAEKLTSAKEGEGEGNVKAGIPSLAQWLGLTLSAEGKYRRRSSTDESVEAKLVREHTSASLFNILRRRLISTSSIKGLTRAEDLVELQVGDLVEIRGTINGDPLRQVLAVFSAIAPYVGIDLATEADPSKPRQQASPRQKASQVTPRQSIQPQQLDELALMRVLMADVAKSTVLDLTMQLRSGMQVVLAASNEYMTDAAEQYMLAGSFVALGKVTQILQPNERINLLRRTVFGVLEATGGRPEDVFSGLASSMPGMNLSSLSITGPGLQVLPLAIYV